MAMEPLDFLEFAVDRLETSALTKAQLAEMLFEQIGLNKRTGESIPIAARRVVTFHASQKLKETIQAEPGAGIQPVDSD